MLYGMTEITATYYFQEVPDGGASFSSPTKPFLNESWTSNLKMVASENNVDIMCMKHGLDVVEGNIPGTKAVREYNDIIFTASTDGGASFNYPLTLSKR